MQAKQTDKYFNLAKIGEKIIGPKTGAIVGGGVGEALVADEDIGTFADMARGTSLEPFAITMMDKSVDKTGRDEAGRRLLNRLKFGTEGIFLMQLLQELVQELVNYKDLQVNTLEKLLVLKEKK